MAWVWISAMEFDEQGNPIPGSGGRDGDISDFEDEPE